VLSRDSAAQVLAGLTLLCVLCAQGQYNPYSEEIGIYTLREDVAFRSLVWQGWLPASGWNNPPHDVLGPEHETDPDVEDYFAGTQPGQTESRSKVLLNMYERTWKNGRNHAKEVIATAFPFDTPAKRTPSLSVKMITCHHVDANAYGLRKPHIIASTSIALVDEDSKQVWQVLPIHPPHAVGEAAHADISLPPDSRVLPPVFSFRHGAAAAAASSHAASPSVLPQPTGVVKMQPLPRMNRFLRILQFRSRSSFERCGLWPMKQS